MSTLQGGTHTILVVEDNEDTRTIIRLEMERYGYTVVEARNGRKALEMLKELCPDLIVMDLNMPEVDGLTAAQAIRRYGEHCAGVPISPSPPTTLSASKRRPARPAATPTSGSRSTCRS